MASSTTCCVLKLLGGKQDFMERMRVSKSRYPRQPIVISCWQSLAFALDPPCPRAFLKDCPTVSNILVEAHMRFLQRSNRKKQKGRPTSMSFGSVFARQLQSMMKASFQSRDCSGKGSPIFSMKYQQMGQSSRSG